MFLWGPENSGGVPGTLRNQSFYVPLGCQFLCSSGVPVSMFLWGASFYVPLGCQFLCSSGVPVSMFLWGASMKTTYDSEMTPNPACFSPGPAGTGWGGGGSTGEGLAKFCK